MAIKVESTGQNVDDATTKALTDIAHALSIAVGDFATKHGLLAIEKGVTIKLNANHVPVVDFYVSLAAPELNIKR